MYTVQINKIIFVVYGTDVIKYTKHTKKYNFFLNLKTFSFLKPEIIRLALTVTLQSILWTGKKNEKKYGKFIHGSSLVSGIAAFSECLLSSGSGEMSNHKLVT